MIQRLASDSRRAAPGTAFFAWPGTAGDGRRHIGDAVARGCAAVLWEQGGESDGFSWNQAWRVPNAGVRGLRREAGHIAHDFHGRPSEALWVCGVTGTNGKTSCSQWISALLSLEGIRTGVIGTLGSGFGEGTLAPVANTTPDALEVHRLLAELRAAGAAAATMEVSSHGLDQDRVNGVAFDCALFTNLTQDHLDYHGSMAAYAAAKARLFEMPGLETAVLNLDDPLGVQLAQRLSGRLQTIGYALSNSTAGVSDSLSAEEIAPGRIRIRSNLGEAEAALPVLGRFNVANALGVLGCLLAKGIPFQRAASLLEKLPAVPGRMQKLGDAPLVVVDYAHTPDALDKALQALRPIAAARGGRLAVVFGAGGNRDAAKRPAMGRAASRLADRIVLTSDNPRDEEPQAIIAAIRAGVEGDCIEEPERARAIEAAIAGAAAADVVLIAGKGHEDYQEIGGKRLPFSDAAQAAVALRRRGGG